MHIIVIYIVTIFHVLCVSYANYSGTSLFRILLIQNHVNLTLALGGRSIFMDI